MKQLVMLTVLSCLSACSSSGGGGNSPSHDSGASKPDSGEVTDSGAPDGSSDDASCPATWWTSPVVPASIEVPADGGVVILHAAGAGTQNYACTVTDAGTVWTLTGPSATLSDCHGVPVGHHFASEAGANYPEWETTDGTSVIGDKIGHFTPDGGAESVPWLLLQEVSTGGSGTLSQAAYVQRLFTDGGVAPGPGCDAGDTVQVPYGADYYFYGP